VDYLEQSIRFKIKSDNNLKSALQNKATR